MRELKFDVILWDGKDKETVEHYTFEEAFLEGFLDFHGREINTGDECVIIRQFTGLQDKNGVDIYEGDVVRVTSYPYKHASTDKDKENPFFGNRIVSYDAPSFWLGEVFHFDFDEEWEIIGNIHENPELLKEPTQ